MTTTTFNRETLLNILHSRAATVKFQKRNGDIRTMQCSLNPTVVPEKIDLQVNEEKNNPDLLTVYDLEEKGWRSFYLDSIIEVL